MQEKLRSGFPADADLDLLHSRIARYEEMVLDTNMMYAAFAEEERAFSECQERKQQLAAQQTALETRLGLVQGNPKLQKKISLNVIRRELEDIRTQSRAVQAELGKNSYEARSAAYRRKLRRGARVKSEIEELVGPGQPFMTHIRQIREQIDNIRSLEKQLKQLAREEEAELRQIHVDFAHKEALLERSADIRREWRTLVEGREIQQDIETIYLAQTNVVCATCTGFASRENGVFSAREYDYVIVDEAARCNLLDLLIPLAAWKKIILVGDHKQLPPMIEDACTDDEFTGKQQELIKEHILFKWLYEERVPENRKIMLDRQYRMHPDICGFVSRQFYDGRLLCEKESSQPQAILWIDSEHAEEIHQKDHSRINPDEAKIVLELLQALDRRYAKGIEVGVICIYKAQANLILDLVKGRTFHNISVECSTVDAFQGKEKHTIILDLVQSQGVNRFASDANRVNVAVSRAQEQLYVVGRIEAVKNGGPGALRALYEYVLAHGGVHGRRHVRNL